MSIRSIAIVACSLLSAARVATAQKEQPDPELASAREKYTKPLENDCNEATDICVRKNNAAAVDVMLEVLRIEQERGGTFLPPAHYRDIVWDGLVRITDPYARHEVEAELKSSKSSAFVKQWCAELLGEYGDVEFGATLLAAMHDKDLGIQRAAARALGKVRYAPAATALLKQIGDKDIYLRANAIEALARIDSAANKGVLERGLKDKDGGVRCALLGAASEIYGDAVEPWDVAALADKDWRPRLQAVDNLGHVRTKTSVDALIGALDDGRPVVAARALKYLQELTGEKHRAKDAWVRWWTEHRESFAFPDGSSKSSQFDDGATVAYHGIQLTSDHVAFLLDASDEMDKKLKSKDLTKRAAALKELEDVMSKLIGRLTFNVMTYAESVRTFEEKGPVELNARSCKKALEFVESAPRGNHKDIWKLLEQVITDPDLDTAYLLSSGEPDVGTYVHWNRVTWHLKDLNRFQKVVIHTIAYSSNEGYRAQIQKIAEATGGEYRWFE